MRSTLLAALTLGLVPLLSAADDKPAPETPVELGDVAWHRDLDAARDLAAVADRPILLFFQEVPG